MWSISNTTNDVSLTKKQAVELSKVNKYIYIVGNYNNENDYESKTEMLQDLFEIYGNKYYLKFIEDHMEHMDYLWNEEITDKLKEMKVKGDITFGSLDGDNAGSNWGYRFDGKGGMKNLVGVISFVEAD